MRIKSSFLYKKLKFCAFAFMLCLGIAGAVFAGLKIFAEPMADDARVDEDQDLTYYITVNSDGIDWTGTESSDSITVDEVSGITTVTDYVPAGLTFVDFVTSPDGTFGAVQRDDKVTACAGKVIDDTNEEGVDAGVWNDQTNEYTYHGLHYDANTRKVTFRTKGITAGCELTVGYIAHTPTLPDNQVRADYYNTARFVDESLTDKSNTVHAYIQKSLLPGNFSLSYKYIGDIPEDAPQLPETTYYETNNAAITIADTPTLEGYRFDGWYWDPPASSYTKVPVNLTTLPGGDLVVYGEFIQATYTPDEPPAPSDEYYPIRYRYDGVVPEGAPALPATEWYQPESPFTMAAKPEVECYSFTGWYWVPYGSTQVIYEPYAALNGKTYNNPIEFYGSFSWTCEGDVPPPVDVVPDKYTVSYEIDGTKPESFNIPRSRSYLEGAGVEVDSTKSGENFDGYDFSGWESDDIELGNDTSFTMPSKNVLLKGSFDRQSYSVSYEFIGDVKPANADSLLPQTTEHYAGDSIEVAGAPSAEGYTFSGWYADPSFEMPAENVTIKGEWVKNKVEFTPEISIEITNPQPEFHKDDTVNFKITVTNNQDFDLNNVWLEEILDGANFVIGDGYTVDSLSFANVAVIPAHGSVDVYAEYLVTKNIEKVYTNTVELIALDAGDSDFVLPEEWENGASVDFATGIIEGLPVDEDDTPEDETPKTYDGIGKAVASISIMASGFGLCAVLIRRNRHGGIIYGYCVAILAASGLAVTFVNGGHIFADNLSETSELDIYSTILNYENGDAGAWKVHESGEWTGVGEAKLRITAESNKISDLHNKDVVLILDNGKWTKSAIDGTEPDNENDWPAMDLMKDGAIQFVEDLLSDGDSRVIVFSTWGNDESVLTGDVNTAIAQIDSITSTDDGNYYGYSTSYDKVLNWLDYYEQSDDRALNIVYVADDHIANSNDIAKYKMIKAKAPNAVVSGIGFGVKELIRERYTSAASADENGIARYWYGADGNLMPIGSYNDAINGLDKISDYHENPYYREFVPALVRSVEGSLLYSKFNIDTTINTNDFDIKGIYGNVGDIQVDGNKISWINEENGLVSGAKYEISVLLKAKDTSVEKHKLYQLNSNTNVETDATDIEEDSNSSVPGIVLMNGYELKFNINNTSTCDLGDNVSRVYLAFQHVDLDEDGVTCKGWNFDAFRSPVDGTIYSTRYDYMPADDIELMATWRKVDVEIHMDGQIHTVAPAVLKKGVEFNKSLYEISKIRYSNLMRKAEACPQAYMDDAHRLSDDSSPTAVYAWFTTGAPVKDIDWHTGEPGYSYSSVVYYCTDADKIYLNEDSTGMFSDYSFTDEDGVYQDLRSTIALIDESVSEWDTSRVKKMDRFFSDSMMGEVTLTRMNDWDVSNVESMDYLFYYMSIGAIHSTEDALAEWDTSNVKSMKYAFAYSNRVLENVGGIAKWDVSSVEDMTGFAMRSAITNTDAFAEWDTKSVKNMSYAFSRAGAMSTYASDNTSIVDFSGLSDWDMSSVEDMSNVFEYDKFADLNALKDWDVTSVKNFENAFRGTSVVTNNVAGSVAGLENWVPISATNMAWMFSNSDVSDLSKLTWGDNVKNVESFRGMFQSAKNLTSLDGLDNWNTSGATTLMSMFMEDTALTDIDALAHWNVGNVTNLNYTFKGISVDNLNSLHDWNVSNVTSLRYTFCGATQQVDRFTFDCDDDTGDKNNYQRGNYGGPKSLAGLEGWKDKTGNVEDMTAMLAGGVITDLSPIGEWDVTGVKNMEMTFRRVNVQNFDALSEWQTDSLENLEDTFSHSRASSLSGLEDWNVESVNNMGYTFAHMYNLASIEALSGWKTDSLVYLNGTFLSHKVLPSLHGLENWNVKQVSTLYRTFEGYTPYEPEYATNWSEYCNTQLTNISALSGWRFETATGLNRTFACNEDLTSLSDLSGWRMKLPNIVITYFDRAFEGDRSVQSLAGLENWFNDLNFTDGQYGNTTFNYTFMNMSALNDVSALSNWTRTDVQVISMDSFMRNDRSISNLTCLDDSIFKTATSRSQAFDNIPSSVARPSWYH